MFIAEGINNGIGNARVSVFNEDGDFLRAFGAGALTPGLRRLRFAPRLQAASRELSGPRKKVAPVLDK